MSGGDDGLDLSRRPLPRPPSTSRRRQILALSGGGYRGLFSARFLEQAEASFGCRARERFDLIAGTSIGALIAAALATNVRASHIVTKMKMHGPRIFAGARTLAKLKQFVWKAPYQTSALRDAVEDTLGTARCHSRLDHISTPLLICAVNVTHGRPEMFRSFGLAGGSASAATLLDAVLASAAAPTYFPTYRRGTDTLVDGGIIANAPEMAALAEALATQQWPLEETYVLAIGTAARRAGTAVSAIGAPSAVSWLVKRRLFQTTLAAQEVLAQSHCEALLGRRYYRVDREPLENQVNAIRDFDVTDAGATETLLSLADESWREHQSAQEHQRFFEL